MVELAWGLPPVGESRRSATVVRSEGRSFPSHRCLVPASEFTHRSHGERYSFSLASGDWFYFAGIWRPATGNWPESYAILTIEPNPDVAPFHDRQMAVIPRNRHMAWLDMSIPEEELLRPLAARTFRVAKLREHAGHRALAL